VLFLVVVPAAIVVVVWALAAAGGPQSKRRYRPGRPYDFIPVWYLANHRGEAGTGHAALPPGEAAASESVQGTTGGASDRW
jgi:hypothetical protein